ncbi:MAG: prolyl oligopeptidase family serine peptidase [Patescibacteria group bacterium]|nr:prolyl oligopeptidase family serine peptidase [Patescibacteria group bacterium]MDE2015620.1 prolyl oligopeptidase family serine peptidase [Patescibacteria group bacterium]MDE2226677.1 prolyl oligopeptidase family serine peptidase [Patescibacteria group bacterium]
MHILRTRFKKEIVSEFLPPFRRADWKHGRIIIFCSGMPSVPAKGGLLEFWSKKGYWVFLPRYRGTWESGGKFLRVSPEKDIMDVIDGLSSGIKDLWGGPGGGKIYRLHPRKIFIIGGSFGGPAAILCSRDKRVVKSVAISPVIDWRVDSKIEPMGMLSRFTRSAFGEAYRFSQSDWKRLSGGKFYSPAEHTREIDGKKIFIIQAKDDKYVFWQPARKFAKYTGAKLLLLKKGGHLSLDITMQPRFYKLIRKFMRS